MRKKATEPDENRGFLSAVFAECGAGMHQAFLRLTRLPERRRLKPHFVPPRSVIRLLRSPRRGASAEAVVRPGVSS